MVNNMKNYRITVNGNVYDVTVEETGSTPSAPVMAAPVSMPAAPAPKAAPVASAGTGAVTVTSPMPGKILAIKTSVGTSVKKGEVLMILEAMKMENEIVAPQDGTVASIDISEGASVEAGAVLASLN